APANLINSLTGVVASQVIIFPVIGEAGRHDRHDDPAKGKPVDEEIMTVVRERCASILRIDPSRVTEDARLQEDLEADSLDLAELHVALEEEWGPMPREALTGVRTVGDVLDRARTLAVERLG